MLIAIILLVPPICLVLAALTDFLEMTIPNRIPAILLGSFIIIAPFTGLTLTDLGWHFLAGLVVFLGCFSLFALNAMGGGDAKLLTAAAVWYGFNSALIEFLVYTGYLGGALTISIIIMRANWDKFATIGVRLPQTLMAAKKIPYAIAIGSAGLLSYAQTPLVTAAVEALR